MSETLLTSSRVLLYGRALADISITYQGRDTTEPPDDRDDPPARLGSTSFIESQMALYRGLHRYKPRLARIYGFAYEGHYYDLAKPAIFLVHGEGTAAEGAWQGTGDATDDRWARTPAGTDRIGVAATSSAFAQDMRIWIYDKGDFSIRLDSESGPLEQILLEAELSSERLRTYFAGSKVRLRGPGRGGSSGE